jgi:hypothetical protein
MLIQVSKTVDELCFSITHVIREKNFIYLGVFDDSFLQLDEIISIALTVGLSRHISA